MMATELERYLDADRATFGANYDKKQFVFEHRLAHHPLFAPDRLMELTKEMAKDPNDVMFDAGDVRVEQRWNEVPRSAMRIDEVLENIETAGGWILLRRAEKFPEYATLLDACMAEIEDLSGRKLTPLMQKRRALIFISSPNRIASYHIDRECNCLLQIRGTKTISVFNRDDREVLPETEIERFFTVDNNAALYKPTLQSRADVFELTPGKAVHIPVIAPHWVQNGPDVSVSLSVNFHYHERLMADIYRANYWLRKAGLNPSPPHRSRSIDAVKRTLYGSARAVKRAARLKTPR
jgi:hypothetical protein